MANATQTEIAVNAMQVSLPMLSLKKGMSPAEAILRLEKAYNTIQEIRKQGIYTDTVFHWLDQHERIMEMLDELRQDRAPNISSIWEQIPATWRAA